MDSNSSNMKEVVAVGLLFVVVAILFGGYYFYTEETIKAIKKETQATKLALKDKILALENQNKGLSENLNTEKNKNDEFQDQISDIAGAVGDLEKLSKTDPELLQKYSKVFFLNEHYTPSELVIIDAKYVSTADDKNLQIHEEVWPKLKRLLDKAEDDGLVLRVASAYRSFGTQSTLKTSYSIVYGDKTANKFSADQGYSEHQLGTTIDFTTEALKGAANGFSATAEYKWLQENAHRYGFILSYPENNVYYQFEPWHWRFVGNDLAGDLDREGKYFYNLDQREIDKYLVDLF